MKLNCNRCLCLILKELNFDHQNSTPFETFFSQYIFSDIPDRKYTKEIGNSVLLEFFFVLVQKTKSLNFKEHDEREIRQTCALNSHKNY